MDESDSWLSIVTASYHVSPAQEAPDHFPDLTRWHPKTNRMISHKTLSQPPLRTKQSNTTELKSIWKGKVQPNHGECVREHHPMITCQLQPEPCRPAGALALRRMPRWLGTLQAGGCGWRWICFQRWMLMNHCTAPRASSTKCNRVSGQHTFNTDLAKYATVGNTWRFSLMKRERKGGGEGNKNQSSLVSRTWWWHLFLHN